MRKIIFTAAFLIVITAAYFFYNCMTTVIADDKGKCTKAECPEYSDCQKQCDEHCDNKCKNCTIQCDKQCDNKEQTQINNCQKSNCQLNSGCGQNNHSPAIIKINK